MNVGGGGMHHHPPINVLPVAVLVGEAVEVPLAQVRLDDQEGRLKLEDHFHSSNLVLTETKSISLVFILSLCLRRRSVPSSLLRSLQPVIASGREVPVDARLAEARPKDPGGDRAAPGGESEARAGVVRAQIAAVGLHLVEELPLPKSSSTFAPCTTPRPGPLRRSRPIQLLPSPARFSRSAGGPATWVTSRSGSPSLS